MPKEEKITFEEVADEIFAAWNKKSEEKQKEAIVDILKKYLFWDFVAEELRRKAEQVLRGISDKNEGKKQSILDEFLANKVGCRKEQYPTENFLYLLLDLNSKDFRQKIKRIKLSKDISEELKEKAKKYVESYLD